MNGLEQLRVEPWQMLRRGLKLVGIDSSVQRRRGQQMNVDFFKSFFGPHPNQCASVWNDLVIVRQIVPPEKADLVGFFMACHFLRCYPKSEKVRSALFGNMELKRARALSWYWVEKISLLYSYKIVWPAHFPTVFCASVDGTHKKSNETRHPTLKKDPKLFSFKHHCAGFNVQIVLHLFESKIMDVFVSRGGENDMGNVNNSNLLNKIPPGKRCIVDGGYDGHYDKLSGYNQFDSEQLVWFKKRAKARHETVNKRLSDYKVLLEKFTHAREKFPMCMFAVAVLVQYGLEDTNPESALPLFEI